MRGGLARPGFGAAQPGARAAEIEGRPAERRRHRPRRRVRFAEQAAAPGEQPEEPAQRDARVEVGGGDAFDRCRRRQPPLRDAHVGTPAQQRVGLARSPAPAPAADRHAATDRRRAPVDATPPAPPGDAAWPPAPRAAAACSPRSRRRAPPRWPRPAPRRCRRRAARLVSRSVSCWFVEAALGDGQLLLQPAQLEVVARDFGDHAHPHIVQRRPRSSRRSPTPRGSATGRGRRHRAPRTRRSRR